MPGPLEHKYYHVSGTFAKKSSMCLLSHLTQVRVSRPERPPLCVGPCTLHVLAGPPGKHRAMLLVSVCTILCNIHFQYNDEASTCDEQFCEDTQDISHLSYKTNISGIQHRKDRNIGSSTITRSLPCTGTPVDPHCAEAAVTLVPASARQTYLACSTRGNVPPNRLSRTNLCDSRPDDAQRQGSLRPVSAGTAQQQDMFDAALSVDQVLRYRDLSLATEVSRPELWSTV
jgi:hypothetical protein